MCPNKLRTPRTTLSATESSSRNRPRILWVCSAVFAAAPPHAECVVRATTAKGELLWMQIALTTVYDERQNPVRAVGTLKDVTHQRETELQLNNNVLHRDIMIREALIYYEANVTQGKVTFGLEALFHKMGTAYRDDYAYLREALTERLVYPEDRAAVRAAFAAKALLACYHKGQCRVELEYRRLTGEGTVIWVRGSAYLSENNLSGDVMLYFYVSDISDQKLRELSPRDRAERDALTGLYNKATAELRIQAALAQDMADCRPGALLLVRVNGLQTINETRGHYFGDALLSELGHQLGTACGSGEIAGHNSGVKFLLYLRDGADAVIARAEALCAALAKVQSGVTPTAGVALCPEHGDSFEGLYRQAGIALSACTHGSASACICRKGLHGPVGQRCRSRQKSQSLALTENVVEHVSRTLYETQDLGAAIQGVLELIIDAFGFHQSYIFDVEPTGTAQCIFECHAPGAMAAPETQREMDRDQVVACNLCFETDDLYLAHPQARSDATAHVLDLLYCYRNAGELCGFVGFNRVDGDDSFTKAQERALRNVLRLLGVFLAGRSVNRELSESSVLLQSVVDGMRTCTYIIDPSTHIIKYINHNTHEALPGAQPGRHCFEALRGRLTPCEDCPIDHMVQSGTTEQRTQMYLEQFRTWARVNASLVTVPGGQVFGVFSSFDFSAEPHTPDHDQVLSDFTHDASLYDALSMSTDDYISCATWPQSAFISQNEWWRSSSCPPKSLWTPFPSGRSASTRTTGPTLWPTSVPCSAGRRTATTRSTAPRTRTASGCGCGPRATWSAARTACPRSLRWY